MSSYPVPSVRETGEVNPEMPTPVFPPPRVASPDRPGGFAGTFQNYLGGDPSDPRNFSTLGQGFDDGGRPFGYIRTQNYGVPMGMPTFRGNYGIPQYGFESDFVDPATQSTGSNFLNSVLEGLIPSVGPAVGVGVGNFLDDFLGGMEQEDRSQVFDIEGAVGDFGPFGSYTNSTGLDAAGALGRIVDIFPRAIA